MKKSIIHIDGDSFFASCEISVNHKLRGKPVVTGQERGIATAMSKEAKALGIFRGMPVYQIRKEYPQAVITHSDYGLYSIFASRMYSIVRRYTPQVEEYSIDECFADITDLEGDHVQIARKIKEDLNKELGMTFSVGLAPTKVLAKLASSRYKPDGFYTLPAGEIREFLKDVPIGKIWGIGPQTSRELQSFGIQTAGEFIARPADWVGEALSKPLLEIWHELNGASLYSVHHERQDDSKSIQQTRTFTPATTDKNFIFSELSKNIEGACVKARHGGLAARKVYYFLKTQEFRYHRFEISFEKPTNIPTDIIEEVRKTFGQVYRRGIPYRASGITLSGLVPEAMAQETLFAYPTKKNFFKDLFKTIDRIEGKYGSHTVVLGSSLEAYKRRGGRTIKRLRIPFIGEVS